MQDAVIEVYDERDPDQPRKLRHAHAGDAGFDLPVLGRHIVHPFSFTDIHSGIRLGLPTGVWARIVGRSSTIRKRGLMVVEGVIDNGYVGPLFTGVYNITDKPVIIEDGEHIAQVIPMPLTTPRFVAVQELRPTERGDKGFGSSGL